MFNFKFNFNFVPVSTDFIENYMTDTHGDYVKVYLYILNMAIKNESSQPRSIAKKLKMMEGDVLNAIEYWQERGLLSSDGENITIGISAFNNEPNDKDETVSHDPMYTKKTAVQVNTDPIANKQLSEIASIAQGLLDKPLTDNDLSTLYWFYDNLGFSAELIMMLLEYCVSKNKRDMRYIEKVAISWHENGINNIEAAEKYMHDESESRQTYYELKKLFNITDRNFTKTEEMMLDQWSNEYKMSSEMIALAYEYCIMSINKLSFQYMDSIIKNWHKAGIQTIEAAEKDHEDFKSRSKKFTDSDTSVYKPDGTDYSKIERLMNGKY